MPRLSDHSAEVRRRLFEDAELQRIANEAAERRRQELRAVPLEQREERIKRLRDELNRELREYAEVTGDKVIVEVGSTNVYSLDRDYASYTYVGSIKIEHARSKKL